MFTNDELLKPQYTIDEHLSIHSIEIDVSFGKSWDMKNQMETHERLKRARKKRGLTQGQVVSYLGLSKSYVSQLESGVNQPAVWEMLAKLAEFYEVTTDYLLGLTDEPIPPAPVDNNKKPADPEIDELIATVDRLSYRHRRIVSGVALLLAADELDEEGDLFAKFATLYAELLKQNTGA